MKVEFVKLLNYGLTAKIILAKIKFKKLRKTSKSNKAATASLVLHFEDTAQDAENPKRIRVERIVSRK